MKSEVQILEKPKPLKDQVWSEGVEPLVSISCITYNHEKFISDAIEGFLMQETTFPVEINIHDDASTDNTANIIREYEKKYPNVLFNVIYQTENQYSKRDGSIRRIQHGRARGKYYAMCEGDDYWIDPLKLQKQVSFLEENQEFVLACGGYKSVNVYTNEEKVIIKKKRKSTGEKDGFEFGLDEMKKQWLTKTLTVVFRHSALKYYPSKKYQYARDIHLFYHLLKVGKGYYFSSILGEYHIHKGGVHSLISYQERVQNSLNLSKELYFYNKDSFTKHLLYKSLYMEFVYIMKNHPSEYTFNEKLKLILQCIKHMNSLTDLRILFAPLIPNRIKELKLFFTK